MKDKTIFVCDSCGYESAKWQGKCPSCGEWNTLREEAAPQKSAGKAQARRQAPSAQGKAAATPLSGVDSSDEIRFKTGMDELDYVLGGGIVAGSLVLLSGEPGIGKSTLLMQICRELGERKRVLYVSGEESKRQIKLRADRLNVVGGEILLLSETEMDDIRSAIELEKPGFVIIDSIQTMRHPDSSSSAGSVAQVRECTAVFMDYAKSTGTPVFLVGHVNKEGAIAGPKVLEHMVDTVLYFEGERQNSYRLLRAVKNRFGATNEVGVFEMTGEGLVEVKNPSAAMLSGRPQGTPGTSVACLMEGTRPMLAEIQALVTRTVFGNPRRMSAGIDYNRMCLLIAVLEKRVRLNFSASDVYLNVIGGLKLDDPSADLAAAAALASALLDKPVRDDTAAVGEIGLAGELRSVSNAEGRIAEAARLGFKRVIIPGRGKSGTIKAGNVEIVAAENISQALSAMLAESARDA